MSVGRRLARSRSSTTNFNLLLPGDDAFERIRASDVNGGKPPMGDVKHVRQHGTIARWRVDAKFGRKTEALEALREWARSVAALAGVDAERVTLYATRIGGRDSAIEMEINGFESVSDVDDFFAAIPREAHAAWTKAFAEVVVDGSAEWTVMRTSGVCATASGGTKTTVIKAKEGKIKASGGGGRMKYADVDESSLVIGTTLPDGRDVVADWKGDPLVVNPGDRMPRF